MAKRYWTEGEINYIDEHSDHMTAATMARILKRSEASVKIKMSRMGIRGVRASMEYLSMFQVQKTLGVQYRTIYKWREAGLETKRIGMFYVVGQDTLVSFLKDHQDMWNAHDVKDDTIFYDSPWFYEKKERDEKPKPFHWSEAEVGLLRTYMSENLSAREIARRLNKTIPSIKNKKRWVRMRYGYETERSSMNGKTSKQQTGRAAK